MTIEDLNQRSLGGYVQEKSHDLTPMVAGRTVAMANKNIVSIQR